MPGGSKELKARFAANAELLATALLGKPSSSTTREMRWGRRGSLWLSTLRMTRLPSNASPTGSRRIGGIAVQIVLSSAEAAVRRMFPHPWTYCEEAGRFVVTAANGLEICTTLSAPFAHFISTDKGAEVSR